MNCPEDNEIVDFLDGHLAGARAADMETHFDACEECRALVAELGRTLGVSNGIAPPTDVDWKVGSGGELVSTGDQVGRYIIVKFIGSGAMGVVYRAYDPELDRSIALKLVRVLSTDDEPAEHARQRLLREAKAMAKLSDPNVITIFDASGFGEWVYLAMELVDGTDLRAWAKETPRDWRAVVRIFAAAARGLWAAHEADIVHRDFKPSNVLIDKREQVRVADFGLATISQSPASATSDVSAPRATAADDSLTVTGTLMGTPAYMSPEVRDGGVATALSDQYSFGVSLRDMLSESVAPNGVLSIVERATQTQPERRFATMGDVADALDRELRGGRRGLAIAVAVVALGIGLAAMIVLSRSQAEPPPCKDSQAQLAGIWDSSARSRVRDAFTASSDRNWQKAFSAVAASFDDYADAWQASYMDSCRATHVTHQQSQVLSDRRMHCLQSELDRFRNVALAFEKPSGAMIQDAAKRASFRNNLHYCNNVDALLREAAIPRPEVAAQVTALTKELREIEALVATEPAGDYLERIEGLAKNARAVGYSRLEADVLVQLGHTRWDKGDEARGLEAFEEALVAAEKSRSPDLKIRAMTGMIGLVGDDMGKHGEGLRIAQFADSLLSVYPEPGLLGEFLNSRAGIFFRKGDNARAERDFRRAYDTLLEHYGPRHHRLDRLLGNMAIAVSRDPKRWDEALILYERALESTEENKGSRHPDYARFLANRSGIYAMQGRQEERLADLRKALQIRKQSLPEAHPHTLDNFRNLGNAERRLGENSKALATLREGARRAQLGLPPDDIAHANFADDIGRALLQLDRTEEAILSLETAVAGWKLAAETRSRDMTERFGQGGSHYVLAQLLWSTKPKRARALAEHSLTLLGDAYPAQTTEIKRWLDSVR